MTAMHVCRHEHPLLVRFPHGLESSVEDLSRQSLTLKVKCQGDYLQVPARVGFRRQQRNTYLRLIEGNDRHEPLYFIPKNEHVIGL